MLSTKETAINIPLVTIIAVCYNHEKFLIETLNSIINQAYSNIELIIIDDKSKDNSVAKINQWIEEQNISCTFIAHEENKGLNKTLDEALNLTNGKYYQSISCDDIMLPDKIEKQVTALEKTDDSYALAFSDAIYIDEESHRSSDYTVLQTRKLSLKNLLTGNVREELMDGSFFSAPTVLLKTDVVKKIGGYNKDISYEDWDLWLRLSRKYKFLFINEVVVKYRLLESSMSNIESKEYLLSRLKIIKREYKDTPKLVLKGRSSLRKLLWKSSFFEKFKFLKEYSFLIDYNVLKGLFNR